MRGTTNGGQSPTGEAYYDAFGLPSLRQGQMPGPQGWAATSGYQTDADSGLMLLGNRYYDPSIGRFLSEDPAGDDDNWYEYCDNDPLDYTDPTGLFVSGLAAPVPTNVGNPLGEMNDDQRAQANDSASNFYLDKWTDVTTKVGNRTVADTGWQLDWSVPLGQDDSGYFQLTGGSGEGVDWEALGRSAQRVYKTLGANLGRGVVVGGVTGLITGFFVTFEAWMSANNEKDAAYAMKQREAEFEEGKLGKGNYFGSDKALNFGYEQDQTLINRANQDGIRASGKVASSAYSWIYGNMFGD